MEGQPSKISTWQQIVQELAKKQPDLNKALESCKTLVTESTLEKLLGKESEEGKQQGKIYIIHEEDSETLSYKSDILIQYVKNIEDILAKIFQKLHPEEQKSRFGKAFSFFKTPPTLSPEQNKTVQNLFEIVCKFKAHKEQINTKNISIIRKSGEGPSIIDEEQTFLVDFAELGKLILLAHDTTTSIKAADKAYDNYLKKAAITSLVESLKNSTVLKSFVNFIEVALKENKEQAIVKITNSLSDKLSLLQEIFPKSINPAKSPLEQEATKLGPEWILEDEGVVGNFLSRIDVIIRSLPQDITENINWDGSKKFEKKQPIKIDPEPGSPISYGGQKRNLNLQIEQELEKLYGLKRMAREVASGDKDVNKAVSEMQEITDDLQKDLRGNGGENNYINLSVIITRLKFVKNSLKLTSPSGKTTFKRLSDLDGAENETNTLQETNTELIEEILEKIKLHKNQELEESHDEIGELQNILQAITGGKSEEKKQKPSVETEVTKIQSQEREPSKPQEDQSLSQPGLKPSPQTEPVQIEALDKNTAKQEFRQ